MEGAENVSNENIQQQFCGNYGKGYVVVTMELFSQHEKGNKNE